MHKSTRTAVIFLLTWTLLSPVIGQTNVQPVQMADAMRSDGKIYVVIAVILTILAGLLAYLISLDRRISRFEKNID
jgi:hypothetical protein